jgi:hypothetical protein
VPEEALEHSSRTVEFARVRHGASEVVGSFLVELVYGGIMIGFAPFHEAVIQGLCRFVVSMAFDCRTPPETELLVVA